VNSYIKAELMKCVDEMDDFGRDLLLLHARTLVDWAVRQQPNQAKQSRLRLVVSHNVEPQQVQ
jgi:hypothetical protein